MSEKERDNSVTEKMTIEQFSERPKAILKNKNATAKREEQEYSPSVNLFFSFDIVNSTQYKNISSSWPLIIQEILKRVQQEVAREYNDLPGSDLWRVIGDEMVFVMPLDEMEQIASAVASIFEITQKISKDLRSGSFFDHLTNQSTDHATIYRIQYQNDQYQLSVKASAWIAIVNEAEIQNPYDNIRCEYPSPKNNAIIEFLGKDIDAGFRVKEHTQDRRLVVSIELAYFLIESRKKNQQLTRRLGNEPTGSNILYIMGYTKLKGVWNGALYPIIWYYNEQIVKDGEQADAKTDFEHSFRYDEAENNLLVRNYFLRKFGETHGKSCCEGDDGILLSPDMYDVDIALSKIITDRNLHGKLDAMREILEKNQKKKIDENLPTELHYAVVCCDVEGKRILIAKRSGIRGSNCQKWEFGCAKAKSNQSFCGGIIEYYKNNFNIDIELVLDTEREQKLPRPIAVYELEKSGNIKKGIIFVAKICDIRQAEKQVAEFHSSVKHERLELVTREQANKLSKEETVKDFHNTIKTVFDNFSTYFSQEKEGL